MAQWAFGDELGCFTSRLDDDVVELVGRPGTWAGVEALGTGFEGAWA